LKKNGTFLLNTIWNAEEVQKNLPNKVKKYLAANNISLYIIDATNIALEIGLGNRTNTILQSAFFKITNVIPYELAVEKMKYAINKSYGKKGEDVVKKNYAAVDRGGEYTKVEVPAEWANIVLEDEVVANDAPAFINEIVRPVNAQAGDDIKVSAFKGREDGTWAQGTTKYEKRGVAAQVPVWNASNCIQCNQCAYVCPHAVVRPFLMTEEELKNAPEGTKTIKAVGKGMENVTYRLQVSVLDCTGCGSCADVCPANKGKALVMRDLESQMSETQNWDYLSQKVTYKDQIRNDKEIADN
jgi:pyruvate-ferredoxin/flavodoxin oxidoreductase